MAFVLGQLMAGRRRGPARVVQQTEFGTVELVPDSDQPGGWTLWIDQTPQSHVDLTDPTNLRFEYQRRLAAVLDTAAAPGAPLRILHLGGGALTLARYVAATRPGAAQRVIERDAALIELVRRELPLPKRVDLRVRAADARTAVEESAGARYDVVITDVFGGGRVPGRCATVEFVAEVARVLRPAGRYAVNLADGPPLRYARRQVATLRAVFAEVCLLAEPGVLRNRRFGNVVLVAATAPGTLPVADLATAAARDPFPARLLHGVELDRFAAGCPPVTDAHAIESPEPPAGLFAG